MRPLIVGTILGVCFYAISLQWPAGGNVQQQNAPPDARNDQAHDVIRHDLLVLFEGEVPKQGQVVIQLYRDAESFENGKIPLDECFLKLEVSDEVLWQFRGVIEGEYAVRAFHDANENWQLDLEQDGSKRRMDLLFKYAEFKKDRSFFR